MSPDTLFWFGLALKIALTAGIVVTASFLVERTSPFIGALIAALPTGAAAAYIILAIEHPAAFVAQSAIGSIAANAITAAFMLVYATLARRHGLLVSLLPALSAWFVGALFIRSVDWTIWSALAFAVTIYGVTILASRSLRASDAVPTVVKPRHFEIPLRTGIVALFVTIVTTASHQIGPFWSGVFAVFPIAMTSFIVILHTRVSGAAASRTLAHAQIPMVGFILAFVVLHLTAVPFGVWWGLAAHLSVCVAFNGLVWIARTKRLI
jgi:hypothetical protein